MSDEESTASYSAAQMPETKKRSARLSGAAKVTGLLLLIFASLYLLVAFFSAISNFMLGSYLLSAGQNEISRLSAAKIRDYTIILESLSNIYIILGFESIIIMIISSFALAGGIGIVRDLRWGVVLSLWWGVAALVYLVIETTIFIIVIAPDLSQYMHAMASLKKALPGMRTMLFGFMGSMSVTWVIIVNIIMSSMPIITIVFMLIEKIRLDREVTV